MSQISDIEVETYLREHPQFFNNHHELLMQINVPHPSGDAVSLVARQLDLFRQRHAEMEAQLHALIKVAQDNNNSANKMHELTLAVLEADSLETAIENLYVVLAECFLADFFSVKIISDEQKELALTNLFVAPDCVELKHFIHEMTTNKASCGRPTLAQTRFLFGDNALQVKSCAIIPMAFTEIEGLVAIGSRDESRFHYSMGHLFLTQMSEIIGTRFATLLKKA